VHAEITLSVPTGIYEDQSKNDPATCQSDQSVHMPFLTLGMFPGEQEDDKSQYKPNQSGHEQ